MPSKPRRTLKLSVKATKLGIRVRRGTNASGGEAYGYSWLVIIPSRVTGGKRIRKQFKSTESREAVDHAEGAANTAKETGQSGFQLTLEQLADAQHALKVLTPLGISLKEAAEEAVRHLRPAGGDITFAKLKDRLLAEKERKNRRPASLQSLRFYVRAVVTQFGADTLVKATTAESLRQWIDSLQDTGMSARHLGNHVAVTKQFFRYAHAHRFIGANPTTLLEGPDIEVKPPAILTLAEVRQLLRTALAPAHRDLLPSVVLGLFCGLRSEELTRLRWEHVNLGDLKITISPEVGKNRRAQDWRYPEIAVVQLGSRNDKHSRCGFSRVRPKLYQPRGEYSPARPDQTTDGHPVRLLHQAH